MRGSTGFWVGIGTGLMAGAVAGMMAPCGKAPMKTQAGRRIRRMGAAVDHAVDDIISELR